MLCQVVVVSTGWKWSRKRWERRRDAIIETVVKENLLDWVSFEQKCKWKWGESYGDLGCAPHEQYGKYAYTWSRNVKAEKVAETWSEGDEKERNRSQGILWVQSVVWLLLSEVVSHWKGMAIEWRSGNTVNYMWEILHYFKYCWYCCHHLSFKV